MAEHYYSFHSDDLDMDFYVTNVIKNPDWFNNDTFCPLVTAAPAKIIAKYRTEIDNAFANATDWSSGIKRVGRLKSGNNLTNNYMMITIYTDVRNNNVVVKIGYGNGSSYSYSPELYNIAYNTLDDEGARRQYLTILNRLNRSNYNYEGMPNYDGSSAIIMAMGSIRAYVGNWVSPGGSYPYGHMNYTQSIWTTADAILTSIPCASNNANSRSQQSESVGQFARYAEYNTASITMLVAYDGSYDPDPPDPHNIDPNSLDPGYPSGPGGGGGNHDRTSDPIAIPGLPTIGAQSLGAVTMYKLTSAEMGVFGQEMTASDLWQAVKLFFQNPQDYIIGCALVPFTPTGDSVWYPKIGAYTFNHSYPIISNQFVEIDCGTLTIDEYWGSCFDYEPYTQITMWLPYIGYRAVPVDEIMNKSIYVKYHVDCLSGDCVAFVGVSSVGPEGPDITKILGQFSGNCAVQMPFGSVTFDQILSSGISMLSGAGVFAATGGNGGGDIMANSAMSMLAGVKGEVQQGGTIGSTGGYMGAQKPYIIKRIRRQSLPENYRELRGYPSNIYGTLSQLTGYAEVDDIQLNNIPAMEVERKEIIELLKGGVLL